MTDRSGVKRCVCVALSVLWVAGSAASELFRCQQPDGTLRFVDSAHACAKPVPHPLERRLERIEPAAPPASAATASPGAPELLAILLSEAEAGAGWEVVREAPSDPTLDPDLVRWGVRAQRARHYTRDVSGTAEVCSVELWSFGTLEQATAAGVGFAYPDWRIVREGEILLMVRGLRRPRRGAPVRGVFAACDALATRVRERAAERAAAP